MSLESVRAFFADKAPDIAVIESPDSSAIRDGAMRTALWVEPAAGTTSSNAFSDRSQ